MTSLTELERECRIAFQKSQAAKEKLKEHADHSMFVRFAQEANDAWLEFKKKELEYNNRVVMKQMGDWYEC